MVHAVDFGNEKKRFGVWFLLVDSDKQKLIWVKRIINDDKRDIVRDDRCTIIFSCETIF